VQEHCFESFHRQRCTDGIVLSDGFDDALIWNRLSRTIRGAIDLGQFQIVSGCFAIRALMSRCASSQKLDDSFKPFASRLAIDAILIAAEAATGTNRNTQWFSFNVRDQAISRCFREVPRRHQSKWKWPGA
jgi:hypothetical protein